MPRPINARAMMDHVETSHLPNGRRSIPIMGSLILPSLAELTTATAPALAADGSAIFTASGSFVQSVSGWTNLTNLYHQQFRVGGIFVLTTVTGPLTLSVVDGFTRYFQVDAPAPVPTGAILSDVFGSADAGRTVEVIQDWRPVIKDPLDVNELFTSLKSLTPTVTMTAGSSISLHHLFIELI